MEYYSTIKRNEIELFVVGWRDLESIIQSEVRKRKTNTICYCIYIESKKNNNLKNKKGKDDTLRKP